MIPIATATAQGVSEAFIAVDAATVQAVLVGSIRQWCD